MRCGEGVSRLKCWLPGMLSLYLVCLLIVWTAMHLSGDRWWVGTVLLFGPRWFVAFPLLILIPWAAIINRKWLPFLAIHVAVILFPICGLRIGRFSSPVDVTPTMHLRMITMNVGGGAIDPSKIQELISSERADVIAIQECSNDMAKAYLEAIGWHWHQWKHLAVGSRFPIQHVEPLVENPHDYGAAVALLIELNLRSPTAAGSGTGAGQFVSLNANEDSSTVRIVCTHQPTPRPGIESTYRELSLSGAAIDEVNVIRYSMLRQTCEAIARIPKPIVVLGDFNTPADSPLYLDHWRGWNNAFDQVGTGFGWTKWTRFHGIRIDHVVSSPEWRPDVAEVGASLGGDHRPLIVELTHRP